MVQRNSTHQNAPQTAANRNTAPTGRAVWPLARWCRAHRASDLTRALSDHQLRDLGICRSHMPMIAGGLVGDGAVPRTAAA